MTDRTVIIQSQQQSWLLDQIEQRLEEIGKVYYANGQAWAYDEEIANLRRLAVQLGFNFDVKSGNNGFEISRFEV